MTSVGVQNIETNPARETKNRKPSKKDIKTPLPKTTCLNIGSTTKIVIVVSVSTLGVITALLTSALVIALAVVLTK
jgi:hypothetical protein